MKLDFSILPILLGLVVLNLRGALSILLVRSVLKLLLNNQGGQYLHWFADEYHCSCCFRNRFCAYLEKEQTIVRFLIASVVWEHWD